MRLVTFNILHGRSLSDGKVDAERFRRAIASLEADVVALQEVDRQQPRSGRLDLAAEAAAALGAGVDYRYLPVLVGTPGQGWRVAGDEDAGCAEPSYGITLLSRLPVRSWRVRRLRAAPVSSPVAVPGTERRFILLKDEPRALLAAVVDTPAGVLTVAATHLSFVPGWNAWQLRRAVAALRGLPEPRLLLGDLNLPGRLPRIVSGWRMLVRAPTYPSPQPKVQFDHVLARGPLPAVRTVDVRCLEVSDHCAVVVDL